MSKKFGEERYRKKKPSSVSKSVAKANHKHVYEKIILVVKWADCNSGITLHSAKECILCGKIKGENIRDIMVRVDNKRYYRRMTTDEIFNKYGSIKYRSISSKEFI